MKVIATADNRSTRRTPAGRLPASTEQEKNAEALLRTRTAELTERIKELNCLYGISNLFETQGVSLPWILQRAVELIPTAWQYPENASARILLDDQVFNTNGFKQTALKQGAEIVVNGLTVGRVEVFYPETDAVSEDGPFLEEERRLLNAISERLSKIIWLKRSEDYLRENEERYRIVTEQVAEGVALVQDGRFCYVNPAFCAFFEMGRPEAVIAESVSALKTGATADIKMVYGSLRSDDCFEKSETVLSLIRNGRTCWYQICHSPITFFQRQTGDSFHLQGCFRNQGAGNCGQSQSRELAPGKPRAEIYPEGPVPVRGYHRKIFSHTGSLRAHSESRDNRRKRRYFRRIRDRQGIGCPRHSRTGWPEKRAICRG